MSGVVQVACQGFLIREACVSVLAIQSMEFSRQNAGVGKPFPSPGDLSNLKTESRSPTLQADSLLLGHQGSPW